MDQVLVSNVSSGFDVVEPRDLMLFIPGHDVVCPRHDVVVSVYSDVIEY